ncbi:MAG: hypothetical protein CL763_04715 [Chloroflexi bacterium]|nr:hypothetical protein [Chloroflexota bacterium]|tara:strand:- start:10576 stop:11352 length:777 start_codon:yes stop_codon:yes gene_type:complete
MAFDFPYDEWASIYDEVYADLNHDLPLYIHQAKVSTGPVLELGSGTGRVSLPIAAEGIDIVGIDISPKMVELANSKAINLGLSKKCMFQTGDITNFELAERFPLIILPYRSFQSLLNVDDQKRALRNIRKHLTSEGLLVMDTFNPDIEQLADRNSVDTPIHLVDVSRKGGGTVVIWGMNEWDQLTQINDIRLIIEFLDDEGLVQKKIYRDYSQRYSFQYEMEHLIELSGFSLMEVYGDFGYGAVTNDSDDLIWIAKAI